MSEQDDHDKPYDAFTETPEDMVLEYEPGLGQPAARRYMENVTVLGDTIERYEPNR